MTEPCYGIVLAGGLGRRMGGVDKALCMVGGHSLLAHVIHIIEPQCAGLLLSANGDPTRFAGFGLPTITDDLEGFKGPLAGLLAGLDWIATHHPEIGSAISVPTDTPFLPADLVTRLLDARRTTNAILACARSGGVIHSVIALWPVGIRRALRTALVGEDLRKVGHFIKRHETALADWPIEPFDPFFNANEPGDLIKAETILAQQSLRLTFKTTHRPGNTP